MTYFPGDDGDNTIYGGNGNDTIVGFRGLDEIYGGAGNDRLYAAYEIVPAIARGLLPDPYAKPGEFINGGSGNDWVVGGEWHDTLIGGSGNDRIWGQDGNDLLTGRSGNDKIAGGLGNDIMYGGSGKDLMIGGDGYDTYHVDNLKDRVVEGKTGGIDTVHTSVGKINSKEEGLTTVIQQYIENLVMEGKLKTAYGNSADNTITGNSLGNFIYGDSGDDMISGGKGRDLLAGGKGNDRLLGDSGVDVLFGDKGDDIMYGGDGVDALLWSEGNDVFFGGTRGDKFQLASHPGDNVTTIMDFEDGVDKIVFARDGGKLSFNELYFDQTLIYDPSFTGGGSYHPSIAVVRIFGEEDLLGCVQVTAGLNLNSSDFIF